MKSLYECAQSNLKEFVSLKQGNTIAFIVVFVVLYKLLKLLLAIELLPIILYELAVLFEELVLFVSFK